MKKDTKQRRLVLVKTTIQKLDDKALENVAGASSCLQLPPPPIPLTGS